CRWSGGIERDIAQRLLTWGPMIAWCAPWYQVLDGPVGATWARTLSCGCRPDMEVRAVLQKKQFEARQGFAQARGRARRRLRETKHDKKWTRDMESGLRKFQPAGGLCGYAGDLTAHHVGPLIDGSGKKPGKVVRVCRSCNCRIGRRSLRARAPEIARALKTAAAQFKEFWESGCAPSQADPAVLKKESPKA